MVPPLEDIEKTQKEIEQLRILTQTQPEMLPELAKALSTLGYILNQLGQWDEAKEIAIEEVSTCRKLAEKRIYLPDLAASLNNLAGLLNELGKQDEALPLVQEAVALLRDLSSRFPSFQPMLTMTIANQIKILQALGREAETTPLAKEFMLLRREMTLPHPTFSSIPSFSRPYRLEWIDLERIGPFEAMRIDFPPLKNTPETEDLAEIHLFTGPNGSGKSTLLYALANQFSEQNRLLVAYRQWKESENNVRIGFSQPQWLEHYKRITNAKRLDRSDALPFAVFAYSGGRSLGTTQLDAIKEPDSSPLANSLSFNESIQTGLFLQWLANNRVKEILAQSENKPEEAEHYRRAREIITKSVGEITGIDRLEFRLSPALLQVTLLKGEHELQFDVLPDGLKSILSWLGDLLMRLDRLPWAIPDLPATKRPFILFLDEVEIHLHPRWQRQLLPTIQKLFPNAQIFATTHSPFVINSIRHAWVYSLDPEHSVSTKSKPSGAGMSVVSVLDEVFGISESFDPETEGMLNKFRMLRARYLKNPEDERIRQELKKLVIELEEQGEEPRLIVIQELAQMRRLSGREPIDVED